MKRLVFVIPLLFFVWANQSVHAQQADYRIIPQPKEVTVDSLHAFTVHEGMSIAYDEAQADVARNASFLQQWIEQARSHSYAIDTKGYGKERSGARGSHRPGKRSLQHHGR